MAEILAELIGYAVLVGIPAALFLAYLLGRVKYDGKGPGECVPPGFEDVVMP